MDDTTPLLQAALKDRYRFERELGTGGMSTVYLAIDLRNQRKVALKVLRPELAAVVAGRRFLTEIKTTANLQHPHILPLFDSGEAGGLLYYVMPFVEGESLRDKLDREGELPIDEALGIASDLAEALDYAHRRGIVHRDIKPENVLLHDGQAVISDFGIALAVDAAGGTRVTGTGQSVGTPSYMSPEQASSSQVVDGRSDVYALACVLHEMLAGEPVFTGPTPRAVLAKHLTVDPIRIRKLRSTVPRSIERTILRALAKSPADRFASMEDFAGALERATPSKLSPRELGHATADWLRAHPFTATATGLALIGTVLVVAPLFSGPSWTDRPSSVAVVAFRESASSEEDVELAAMLADAIGRELQRWDGMMVATDVDLAGPRRDMGLSEPVLEGGADGLALARAVRAQAMLAVTARRQGDSISLRASLFDSRSSRRVSEPVVVRGSLDDSRRARLMAPVVAEVLGFADAPEPHRAIGAGTGDPGAAEAYLRGRDALERNQLDVAEAFLSHAVQLDTSFATALSFRAQADFWRAAEDDYFIGLGPEISRWSTAATRHAQGLSPENDGHVRAFYALQLGDFEEARSRYASLFERDNQDAYALLMAGEVELLDRWLIRDDARRLVPRSNVNIARRAFSDVVRMEPTFELAYGRVFAIQTELEGNLNGFGGCDGFEELGDGMRPIWQRTVPSNRMRPFCLAASDSLVWLPRADFMSRNRAAFRQGADRLFRQAVSELERWAAFAPDQSRPLELLSDAYVLRRRQLQVTAPQRHRSAAEEALRYAEQALALRPDTTASDLARLATLALAAEDLERAVGVTRVVLSDFADASPEQTVTAPDELMNVLVATGRVSAALAVAAALPDRHRFITDPETGEGIEFGLSADRIMTRLRVLGASGVGGVDVRRELDRLREAWAGAGYSAPRRKLLREFNTERIAASLVQDSASLAEWARSVEIDEPLWVALALGATDPARATDAFRAARASLVPQTGSTRTFLLAMAAKGLGRTSDAIALFSRLDSIPRAIGTFDPGWGLQVRSHLLRAELYAQEGDSASAVRHLHDFIEARSWPDSLSRPRVEYAEALVGRLRAVDGPYQ